jgi:hypothetical protein
LEQLSKLALALEVPFNSTLYDKSFASQSTLDQHKRDPIAHVQASAPSKRSRSISSTTKLPSTHEASFHCKKCKTSSIVESALEQHTRDAPAHTPASNRGSGVKKDASTQTDSDGMPETTRASGEQEAEIIRAEGVEESKQLSIPVCLAQVFDAPKYPEHYDAVMESLAESFFRLRVTRCL